MNSGSDIADIAAVLGDPARAKMVSALMGGGMLNAGDLAFAAQVSAQTASGHLAKLVEAGLLAGEKRGRFRFFRLASAQVARMLEEIMAVAAKPTRRYQPLWMRDEALRSARTCYDHLAGRLGVALAASLAQRGFVLFDQDGGVVTEPGAQFLNQLGLDLACAAQQRRRFCRPCLDWSEQRPHLGGAVGAALAQRCFALGWVARIKDSRAVAITDTGRARFLTKFGIAIPAAARG
jgi:DNA-binding transcriptional ArsR family regulator